MRSRRAWTTLAETIHINNTPFNATNLASLSPLAKTADLQKFAGSHRRC